jgi:ubiquinone/menaquinone biosynthesis C-methylase UbiE
MHGNMELAHRKAEPSVGALKEFWDKNPLSTAAIDEEPGSPAFFRKYDGLREVNEPLAFAKSLHEYEEFLGKRVLEVGCGNAYTLGKYAEHGAEVYGVDITEAAVKISRQRFDHGGLKGDFRIGNAEELPYKSNYFDCICSMGVLHHVPDPEKAISEIYRCLKPGGRVIVMFYHRNSILYRFAMPIRAVLTGKSLQQLVNEVDGVGNPKGDVYSKKELRYLLRSFKDIEMFAGLLQPSILRSFLPPSIAEMLGKKWGWFLYAKGRK